MPELDFFLIAGFAAAAGAVVQSGMGLGLGLVAAPVVTLLFPALMPGSLLIAATVLPLFVLVKEFRHADVRGVGWALGGRVAGTPLGVWFVASFTQRRLGFAVGGMVLTAIVVSLLGTKVPRNQGTLIGAGLLAGVAGTATSVGGAPIALLYQRETGPQIRATLSVFFTIGALLSVLTLAAVGQLPWSQVAAGLALTPFVVAGFAVSGPLRRYLDSGRTQAGILAVTGASAVVLIGRSLF